MAVRNDRVTVEVVPADLEVFAFSDAHGEITQLRDALRAAMPCSRVLDAPL